MAVGSGVATAGAESSRKNAIDPAADLAIDATTRARDTDDIAGVG
jgi:hypothetical protein